MRPVIVWLREDLRLDDHPVFQAAGDRQILVVYIHNSVSPGLRPLGGASRWWLARSLAALSDDLAALGARLDILSGAAEDLVLALARASGAQEVVWSRRYGAAEIEIDTRLKAALQGDGIAVRSVNARLLREPWEVFSGAGAPFKVFTPFWRRHRDLGSLPAPAPAPERLVSAPWPDLAPRRVALADLALTPKAPDWSGGLAATWRPGEAGARERLRRFVSSALADYPDRATGPTATPRPGSRRICASAKSPRAAFFRRPKRRSPPARFPHAQPRNFCPNWAGASFPTRCSISRPTLPRAPGRRVSSDSATATTMRASAPGAGAEPAIRSWTRECGTLDHRLYAQSRSHGGRLVSDQAPPDRLAARRAMVLGHVVRRRQRQQRRELAMGRRLRRRRGAYFRDFNPVLQGEKFDPEGAYVRRWVPELAGMEAAHIHAPWLAPAEALRRAGVKSGQSYPAPIVDHAFARRRALEALASLEA